MSVSSFGAETNTLTISVVGSSTIRVTDSTGVLTPGSASCSGTTTTIDCTVTDLAATVFAGPGNDNVTVSGPIRSQIEGLEGNDVLQGGSVNDQLTGGSGDDASRGGGGDDLLFNSEGSDDLDGQDGSDILYSGPGPDVFADTGAFGNDRLTYFFETGPVRISADDGLANDGRSMGTEGDEIRGGFEGLQGGPHDDIVIGGPAGETINGSAGADDITGGPGVDHLEGNSGEDTLHARDGVADDAVACDSPSDPPPTGTDELAETDANDPAVLGCEREDRTPGGTTPPDGPGTTPTTPTTPGTPGAAFPGCPTDASLYLRPDATAAQLRSGAYRVLADVPVAGWRVTARYFSTEAATEAIGPLAASVARTPGRIELRPTLDVGVRDGSSIAVVTTVQGSLGCPVAAVSDTIQLDAKPDGASTARAAAGTRSGPAPRATAPVSFGPCDKLTEVQKQVLASDLSGLYSCVPYEAPPAPPKCEGSQQLTSVTRIIGACILKTDTGYRSERPIALNGIEITPGSGSGIAWDAAKTTLTFTGTVKIAVPFTDGGHRSGELVVYDGPVPKSGFKLDGNQIEIGEKQLSKKGTIKGFPVAGSLKINLTLGGGTVDARFALPKRFAGINKLQGGALMKFGPNGIELTDAVLKFPPDADIRIGKLRLKKKGVTASGELRYKRRDGKDTWAGKLHAELPAAPVGDPPSLDAELVFTDGKFASGSLALENINKPFGHPSVFLQRIKAGAELEDNLRLYGGIGVTFGPKLGRLRLASLDVTNFEYTFTDPGVFKGAGELEFLGGSKTTGSFVFSTDGRLDFSGKMDVKGYVAGIEGTVAGTVLLGDSFTASGRATITIPLTDPITGGVTATNKALSVCGSLQGIELGVTYVFATEKLELLQGCGLEGWGKGGGASRAATTRAATRAASAVASTTLAAGLPKAAFSATGQGGVPDVVLVGPKGERVSATGAGAVVIRSAADNTVYFVVARPSAGTWTLETQDGSVPVASNRVARGLPEVKVSGVVKGSGDKRQLAYTVDGPPETRVTFLEQGVGAGKQLATATGKRSGTAAFTPVDGTPGVRTILAVIERDGFPAGTPRTVAKFRIGAPPAAGAIECPKSPFKRESRITIGPDSEGPTGSSCDRMTLRRVADGLEVKWGAAAGATAYRLIASAEGRRTVRLAGATTRRLVLKGIEADDTVTVELAGLNEEERPGPAVRGTMKALVKRTRPAKTFPDDKVLGVLEVAVE